MPRCIYTCLALAAALTFSGGCAGDFNPQPRPAVVGHMDIAQKQEFIRATKTTLKNFQLAARDLRSRNKPLALQELNGGVRQYIRLQVAPIVGDFEAENNLETRLEVAKLQLLCGLVFAEMGDYAEARRLVKEMDRRYGENSSLLETSMDRRDIGFASLGDGLQTLRARIEHEASPPSPGTNPMATPRS